MHFEPEHQPIPNHPEDSLDAAERAVTLFGLLMGDLRDIVGMAVQQRDLDAACFFADLRRRALDYASARQ